MDNKITKISNGSISKKANGKYIVQITITFANSSKRVSRVANTKREAQQLLHTIKQELLAKIQNQSLNIQKTQKRVRKDSVNIYVNYLLTDWLTEKECVEKLALSTLYTNKLIINKHIKGFFGKKLIQDIMPQDIVLFYTKLCNKKYSPDTVHKIAGVVSNSFKILCRDRRVQYNPTFGIKLPRLTIIEKEPLSQKEIDLLLECTDKYDSQPTTLVHNMPVFIKLAIATGCRRGELCALKWDDINFKNNTVHVAHAISEVRGKMLYKGTKTNKERTIMISANIVELLRRHKKTYATGTYVFRSKFDANKPQSPTSVRHSFEKITKMTGINRLTLHLLRHTSISILAANCIIKLNT